MNQCCQLLKLKIPYETPKFFVFVLFVTASESVEGDFNFFFNFNFILIEI